MNGCCIARSGKDEAFWQTDERLLAANLKTRKLCHLGSDCAKVVVFQFRVRIIESPNYGDVRCR